MTEIEKMILENQEIIMLTLNKLLTPYCKGSILDRNGETQANICLIDNYHKTRKILGKEY
jgi:hypothetical protein